MDYFPSRVKAVHHVAHNDVCNHCRVGVVDMEHVGDGCPQTVKCCGYPVKDTDSLFRSYLSVVAH